MFLRPFAVNPLGHPNILALGMYRKNKIGVGGAQAVRSSPTTLLDGGVAQVGVHKPPYNSAQRRGGKRIDALLTSEGFAAHAFHHLTAPAIKSHHHIIVMVHSSVLEALGGFYYRPLPFRLPR